MSRVVRLLVCSCLLVIMHHTKELLFCRWFTENFIKRWLKCKCFDIGESAVGSKRL